MPCNKTGIDFELVEEYGKNYNIFPYQTETVEELNKSDNYSMIIVDKRFK